MNIWRILAFILDCNKREGYMNSKLVHDKYFPLVANKKKGIQRKEEVYSLNANEYC